jgi:hypothetical protein
MKEAKRSMAAMTGNIFLRHEKKTWAILVLLLMLATVIALEVLLRRFIGLGNPVLYDSSPVYGFRPLPGMKYHRPHGVRIRFNNLALRAAQDFNDDPANKVLFLGDSVTYSGSYVDDEDLFSSLAVKGLGRYESGNAGVNAWGVENICGLVVESNFLPAEIYITTLPEVDFYRGLTRCQGTPFFNVAPRLALVELWRHFCFRQNARRYRSWEDYADDERMRYVVEKAARRLKEMDEFLREKGFRHLIFISPNREQVLGHEGRDAWVEEMLRKYDLHPVYIADKLSQCGLSLAEKKGLFHDGVHLESPGHKVWAQIIRRELDKMILP